jgi:hypothetical protein
MRFACSSVRGKFLRPGTLEQTATVLVLETEEQVSHAFGHVDEAVDLLAEGIVAAQEGGFLGQVPLDRSLHADVRIWREEASKKR